MAFLGLASVLLFFISLIVVINPKWFFRGKIKPSRKLVSLVVVLSFACFLFALSDKPTGSPTITQQSAAPEVQKEDPIDIKIIIDDKLIARVVEYMKANDQVEDAAIVVEDDRVSMVATVGSAVNEETAKSVADSFVRTLGSEAGGKSPKRDYYGEVYDYYSMMVNVVGPDGKQIVSGSKVKSATSIRW
ncbi:hypothetical protein EEL32_22485 [Brevibacillus laterosporus]|nr:hypothetical protein [Brevibacillus laterosporus]TPG77699.1 hypothetical protein EEL32_22485 [Brevibacillus laterosporus]